MLLSRPGEAIGGRYRLVAPIATGGMGTVWEGWDERLQRRVALKQLHPQPGLSPEDARIAGERALREARNTARLHHANAVPVYDVVDHEGQPCLVMQYLPARSLQAILAERGTLDVAQVARIGAEVASALEAAHQVGIVHRDVKPGNVLIDEDGSAMLTDFGISHAIGDSSITSTGLVTGTPAYLAPEVARGAPATAASDVFSLGSMLYTALEGTSPFGDGQNAMATLHRAASGQIAPPRRSGPLTPLLAQMLAVDPGRRPRMGEVAGALRSLHRQALDPRIAASTQQMAPPPPGAGPPPSSTVVLPPGGGYPMGAPRAMPVVARPGPPAPPERRSRSAALVAAAVIAALLVAGLVLLLVNQADDNGSGSAGAGAGSTGASTPRTSPRPRTSSKPSTKASRPSHSSTPPSSPPSKVADTSTASSQDSSSTTPPASDPATALTHYYSLLPGDPDAAFALLGPTAQSQSGGRAAFTNFYGTVAQVAVEGARATGDNTVSATVRFVLKDGRITREPYRFVISTAPDGSQLMDQFDRA